MADLAFSTPQWINTIISEKMKRVTQEETNAANVVINEAKNKSNELISQWELQSKAEIAELDRASREDIAKLDRENALRIAEINAAANVGSSVIRILPPLLISSQPTDSGGKGSTPSSPLNIAPAPAAQTAKQKADALFPSLEPTFKFSPVYADNEGMPVSTVTQMVNSKPSLTLSSNQKSNRSSLWTIPAIGLALSIGSGVAMKQFDDGYNMGGFY